jgi:hypothetical protein
MRPIAMQQALSSFIALVANFVLIVGLVIYGFTLFAGYHASGRWAKNITELLGGLGMLTLALALAITPANVQFLMRLAETELSIVCLWISSALLLAAMAAYGIITYSRPFRLWHERRIRRDLNRDLPKIP